MSKRIFTRDEAKTKACSVCPFRAMPRILSLAIAKHAFADAPTPKPKPERRISIATGARQLSALDMLFKRGLISKERHAEEVAMLKAKLAVEIDTNGTA